jgi:hypothetical protein
MLYDVNPASREAIVIRGSCLCGTVRFEIDKVWALTHCHCTNCRKISGAAFATYAHVKMDRFRFVSGEESVIQMEWSPGKSRPRCKVCGCSAPGKPPYLETISVPAGLLDDDPGVRPSLHVFASSCAPWWTIADDLPQHAKWVPGYEPKKA